MSHWVRIASLTDCPPGASLECVAEDRIVALFNVEGELFALDGICPHQGGPLGKGALSGCIITCPWHGFQFDVTNGRNVSSPAIVQGRYDVKVEDGAVYVTVGDGDAIS
ncbi:MAG: Rieske 2Fe-2S domain-containing protein [Pirellulaceae bacterium]